MQEHKVLGQLAKHKSMHRIVVLHHRFNLCNSVIGYCIVNTLNLELCTPIYMYSTDVVTMLIYCLILHIGQVHMLVLKK